MSMTPVEAQLERAAQHRNRAVDTADEAHVASGKAHEELIAAMDQVISVAGNLAARVERLEGTLAHHGIWAPR
jgi:phosphopantothenate synthetase